MNVERIPGKPLENLHARYRIGNIYSQRSLHALQRWDNCIAHLHGTRRVVRSIVAVLRRSGLSSRSGIQRKQLLRVRDAAQRIAAYRTQAALDVADSRERSRHQDGLIERTAHRRYTAGLVNGRPMTVKSKRSRLPTLP